MGFLSLSSCSTQVAGLRGFFRGGGNRLNLREEKCSLGKTDQSKVRTLTLGTYDVGEIPEAIEAF